MKEMPHPVVNPYEQDRKKPRWDGFDYGRTGIYFVTLCAFQRKCFFGEIVDGAMHYFPQGSIAEVLLNILPRFYPKVEVLDYVVMPDHIHVLMAIDKEGCAGSHKETISSVVGSYKSSVSRHCHRQGLEMKWQTSFFDRVVRNEAEQEKIATYIDNNVRDWEAEGKSSMSEMPF